MPKTATLNKAGAVSWGAARVETLSRLECLTDSIRIQLSRSVEPPDPKLPLVLVLLLFVGFLVLFFMLSLLFLGFLGFFMLVKK